MLYTGEFPCLFGDLYDAYYDGFTENDNSNSPTKVRGTMNCV